VQPRCLWRVVPAPLPPTGGRRARVLLLYHPDAFWFADDVFTIIIAGSSPWRRAATARISISYECIYQGGPHERRRRAVARRNRMSPLWIGSESGSQRILDHVTPRRVEQVQAMTHLAQRMAYRSHVHHAGLHGRNARDNRSNGATRPDRPARCRPHNGGVSIKGTRFYEETVMRWFSRPCLLANGTIG